MSLVQATEPTSWAGDLNSYRKDFGAQKFATLSYENSVERLFIPYVENAEVQAERFNRHGWNDTSLLKEDGVFGEHPRSSIHTGGRQRPASLETRKNLFGVLQGSEEGITDPDAWVGNKLIDPTKGKSPTKAPTDKRGRRDLFDVLNCTNPGKPSDDQWLGNSLINPAKGRLRPAGPEEKAGRRDLFGIIQQQSGTDQISEDGTQKLSDSWIGNRLIHPLKGKQKVEDVQAAQEHLIASTFKGGIIKGWSDMPTPHNRKVIPKYAKENPTARDVITGLAKLPTPRPPVRPDAQISAFDGRTDLYPIMQNSPLSNNEKHRWVAWDDSRVQRRKPMRPYPGQVHPSSGSDMLYWRPDEKASESDVSKRSMN
ncbi:hypothetical protein BSKO_14034 [Bryopsis sp. KO-2023]|nr:hypothetical protein BSKO_14034 [Bryopsis sp. KO-2023]